MPADAVRQYFVKHRSEPSAKQRSIVAAISGGTDSTALLLALADLRDDGFEIHAAHVNHHLRGADSDADEAFVRALCTRLGITLHVADGTLDADRVRECGIEAAAREVRYARLLEIRDGVVRASGAPSEARVDARTTRRAVVVATAHQKNDQAETVLMRLLTGTGIAGLRGIHPLRDDGFARPLLDVPRDAIEAFLRERGIEPRHDRSNDDPRFLRNRVRLLVRELGAVASLAALADQARALWPILERAIDEEERACAEVREQETHFHRWPDDPWLRQALLHRHIHRLDPGARDVSAKDLARLAAEIDAIKRVSVTKTLELIRKENVLVLRTVPQPTPEFDVALTPDSSAYIPELAMTVHLAKLPGSRNTEHRQPIQVPPGGTFTVRNRRSGDRFNAKKLKDFLIDRRIAADLRDRIPLLVWNDEIVWVAGIEVSDRFKVETSSAGDVYEVWLEGS